MRKVENKRADSRWFRLASTRTGKDAVPEPPDKYAKIRLRNSQDISVIFVKLAMQKGMMDGLAMRWNGADRPTVAREKHQIEFIAGKRIVRRELSDSALVNLQANVCLEVVWKMIREVVTELQARAPGGSAGPKP